MSPKATPDKATPHDFPFSSVFLALIVRMFPLNFRFLRLRLCCSASIFVLCPGLIRMFRMFYG